MPVDIHPSRTSHLLWLYKAPKLGSPRNLFVFTDSKEVSKDTQFLSKILNGCSYHCSSNSIKCSVIIRKVNIIFFQVKRKTSSPDIRFQNFFPNKDNILHEGSTGCSVRRRLLCQSVSVGIRKGPMA